MALSSNASNRILWIDLAKAIGMCLVILAHTKDPEYPSIFAFVSAFLMPLFFFISGYLEKDGKSFKETVLSGIKTLLVPYILLSLLYYLYRLAVAFWIRPEEYADVPLQDILLKPVIGIVVGLGSDTDYSIMHLKQFWFLLALFWAKIIHYVVKAVARRRKVYYFVGVGVVIGCVFLLKCIDTRLWFSIDCAVLAFPFLALGYMLRKTNILALLQTRNTIKIVRNIAIALVSFVVLVVAVNYNGRVDVNNFSYGDNCALFYMLGAFGIMSIISISMLYRKQLYVITTISSGTILILWAHHHVNAALLFIAKLLGVEINLFLIIIAAVANVIFMTIPIKIVQRYAPILMGRYK